MLTTVSILGASRARRRIRARGLFRPAGLAFAVALAAAMLLGGGSASVLAVAPSLTHTCGYFFKRGSDVIVRKGGPVSCKTATSIVKDFWDGTGVTQHGTSDANSYWTIKAYRGWVCEQSMGEGDCHTAKASAGYVVKA
jgi:hypothetical protein